MGKFGVVVGFVPGDVFDSRILGVMDFSTDLLHGGLHTLRLGDGNNFVIAAVKDPYGNFADFRGDL